MWAARGLRFCAALRLFRRPADFLNLGIEAPPDRSRRGHAGGLHRPPRALAGSPTAAPAGAEALLRKRRERSRRRNRDQLGDERTLEELDERLSSAVGRAPAAF